jgi:probable HAF family extracellular repeat protein
MKSRFLMCLSTTTVFVALATPLWLVAQAGVKAGPHYKFVEIGTLGGPNSAFTGQAYVLSNSGVAVGTADTSTPDPNYPNYNPLLGKNPFIQHAFRWENGRMMDMHSFPGTNSTYTNSLNASGAAIGLSENGSIDPVTGWPEATAAMWVPGLKTPKNLGTLPGGYESFAILINDSGVVAGVSENGVADPYSFFGFPTQTRTFVWKGEKGMIDIGTLGGPDAAPYSSTINQSGQVAGLSYTNGTPNSVSTPCGTNIPKEDPFFWDGTKMWDIGTLGGTCGFAIALNNVGQVVGQSDLKGDGFSNYHPFFWEVVNGKGKLTDIGTFGGPWGIAGWINDAGEVVGLAETRSSQLRAFLWKKGEKKRELGILKGDACDAAWGINSRTQIIGDTSVNCQFTPQRPFLWENGSLYDLSTLFPAGHFNTAEAVFINDSGEIAGTGVLQNGNLRAFLLIPCKAGTKGCKGLVAGTAAHPATITQDRTAVTQGSRSPSEGMTAVRDRLGRGFPYGGLGTHQEEK